jgi:hypothetical protein
MKWLCGGICSLPDSLAELFGQVQLSARSTMRFLVRLAENEKE